MSPVRSPYLAAPSRGPAVVVRAGPEHAATSAAIAKALALVAAKRAASTAVATSDPTADAAPSLIPKLRSSNVGSVKKGLGPRSASAMEPRAGAIPVSSSTPATPRASPSKAPSAQKSPSLSGTLSPREARPLPSLIPTLTAPARPAAVPVPPVLPLDREGSVRSLLRKASEESVKSALKSPIKSSPRPALQTEAPRKRMIARHQSAANADAVVSPAPPSARSAHATHHARARASSITPRTPTATPPAAAAQPPPTLGSLVRQLKRGFSGRVDVDALQVATPSKSPVATRVPKPSILITDSAAPPKSGRVRHSSVQPSSSRAAPTLVATPTPNPATAFPMKRGEPTPMAEAGAARRKRSLSPTSAARALRLEARRQAETAAARKRLEVYARNAIMRQWVQRNMQIFHEQMTADAGGAAARSDEGFAV